MSDDAGEGLEPFECRNCHIRVEGQKPDHLGLCPGCRAAVVRRSTALAVLPTLVAAALYLWLLAAFDLFESRFVIVWIALGVGLVWVAFKIARRVLFDVVRGRGVPVSKT